MLRERHRLTFDTVSPETGHGFMCSRYREFTDSLAGRYFCHPIGIVAHGRRTVPIPGIIVRQDGRYSVSDEQQGANAKERRTIDEARCDSSVRAARIGSIQVCRRSEFFSKNRPGFQRGIYTTLFHRYRRLSFHSTQSSLKPTGRSQPDHQDPYSLAPG